jgi:hypothetical protein
MIKGRKTTVGPILISNLQMYPDSSSYLNDVLCSQRKSKMGDYSSPPFVAFYHPVSSVTFNLGQFLRLSLIFITFMVLHNIGQLLCWFLFRLGSCDVSSWFDSGYAMWAVVPSKWCWVLPNAPDSCCTDRHY